MTINQRLAKVFKERNIKSAHVADSLGIDRSSVSKMVNGKLNVSLRVLEYIRNQYGLDLNWIICGKYGTNSHTENMYSNHNTKLQDKTKPKDIHNKEQIGVEEERVKYQDLLETQKKYIELLEAENKRLKEGS